jgi:hypothetical protein
MRRLRDPCRKPPPRRVCWQGRGASRTRRTARAPLGDDRQWRCRARLRAEGRRDDDDAGQRHLAQVFGDVGLVGCEGDVAGPARRQLLGTRDMMLRHSHPRGRSPDGAPRSDSQARRLPDDMESACRPFPTQQTKKPRCNRTAVSVSTRPPGLKQGELEQVLQRQLEDLRAVVSRLGEHVAESPRSGPNGLSQMIDAPTEDLSGLSTLPARSGATMSGPSTHSRSAQTAPLRP